MTLKEMIKNRRKISENKKLVKKFPFLLPRNRWTYEIPKDYDYSYTELDEMPYGWRKAFGEQMCQELKEELDKFNFTDKYRIIQIKEKYGTLRWYDGGYPIGSKVQDIISKYEDLSMCYCYRCGKPTKYRTEGWIEYFCEDCKDEYVKKKFYREESFIELTKDDLPERVRYIDKQEIKCPTDPEVLELVEKNWKSTDGE